MKAEELELSFADNISRFHIKGKLAIACSGGIDSMALSVLSSKIGIKLTALIIDHGLRKASAKEAEQCSVILNKLGIENVILKAKGSEIQTNIQSEARQMRYRLLLDYCKKHKIKFLATAHHADDNAETFLLRLSRGSGVDGLSSISDNVEMEGVHVIRPLLPFTKQILKSYLKAKKIKWVEDPTNATQKYKRNTLRYALDKLESKELITARINDAALNLSRVREFLEICTDQALAKCTKLQGQTAEIDIAKFNKLHDEISFRVLLKIISTLKNPKERPRFESLKRLKAEVLAGKTRTLAGLIFKPNKGKIIIYIE